ncbi:plasmid mobilization relaxosome protein MobC [Glaciimonas sp. GNP009]
MPSAKPLLKTRVTDEIKVAFLAQAQAQGLSEARLLEVIVSAFLQRNPPAFAAADSSQSEKLGGVKSEDVRVRLSLFEYHELARLADIRHWKRGTYLAHLLRVHLTGQPRFSENEMLALREATTQLSAMGRNVNQIARALNTSLDEAHLALAVPFEEMKALIDQERSSVKDLIRANLKSWGVTNGD